ncbi:MAG: hypothetical protein IJB65_02490 [Clostridia bacterium]|nr:hypothetical protein [Clostridia bacterium]
MEEKKDLFEEYSCDCCDDECMKLSLDEATEEDLDKLWDEADEDEFDICASEEKCNRRKCIITALVIGAIIAITAVVVYKICKRSDKNN